jgi:rSAM/selenodomain-associated transferase 1
MTARPFRVTLGVMARAPVSGRCKTRLAKVIGADAAARLYRAMLADSLEVYGRAGADRQVVLAAPEDDGVAVLRNLAPANWGVIAQEGVNLGERLAGAACALGADGSAVVLVDSDSPTLPIEPVAAALQRLAGPRRALLGPCVDGGYYLVGLTTPEPGVFRDIPWSTPGVLAATRARCAELSLALEELPPWYDVDEPVDLERFRAELARYPDRAPRCAALLRELSAR